MPTYRGVQDSNGRLIAFGIDDNQSGAYHDLGTWCTFTFESFPESSLMGNEAYMNKFLYKVSGDAIVARTQEEVDADQ